MQDLLKRYLISILFVVGAGACGGSGGCGGCALEPLPAGGLPADQTIEGGAQLRISSAGFDTLTSVLPAILGDTFADGTCIGASTGTLSYCYKNDGQCSPGCKLDLNVDSIDISVPQDNQLRVRVQFDIDVDLPAKLKIPLAPDPSCTLHATSNNTVVNIIVGFKINPTSGELEVGLQSIEDVDINLSLSGCAGLGTILSGLISVLDSVLDVGFIRDLLTPVLEPIIQGILPDPLGLEGIADLSGLIGSVSPGTRATLETRIVPGGYVHLERGGLSLGIITGINADEDLTTRSPDLDSEPALCVPPFAAPDFAAAPALLTRSSRQNFKLNPADLFRGLPDSVDDLVIGASETMLDQIGHHLISSGALCMSIGTELIPQLNLAALGILVPSFAELGSEEGNDPMLLVTRPARAIDFSIGEGTTASPSLTLHLSEFAIDFYAFLFERYTRGFTVTLDLEIGINLEFTTDASGKSAVMPILVGLEADNIGVTVLNEEFLREDKATLEAVFPSLLDLIVPLITNGLGAIALPDIAGFQLDQLSVKRVTTSEDDFLAIGANLAAGSMMMSLGQSYPSVAALAQELAPMESNPTSASARLVDVIAPSPLALRAGIMAKAGGETPAVIVDLDTHDELGRELEWTWNIEGGMWRPLIRGGQVSLEDGAFNFQGKYQLQFRARVVGDYRSWDPLVSSLDVVIDSVGPRILLKSAERTASELVVPAFDNVYLHEVEVAFGVIGAEMPSTAWSQEGRIALSRVEELAVDGEILVFARDPQGNTSHERLRISKALVASTAGGCSTGGQSGLAGLFAVIFALGFLRKRSALLGLLAIAGLATAMPACSCSGDPAGITCEIDEDCIGACEAGKIGQCFEQECRCLPDVSYGRIGQFSSMDLSVDGTVWVSGYASNHGDLVVANTREMGRIPNESWQFVDGVPEGPIVLPPFAVRGGIRAPGEDVGLYTDIAAVSADLAMVSYFDATSGSLKFAANYDGGWQKHVIDAGDLSADDTAASKIAGQYSSISLSTIGVPTVAYFAHVGAGGDEARTELRVARANTAAPRSGSDWTIEVVDSALVPASEANADILRVPYGLGLFVEMTRDNNDELVIVYYDRIKGDLKLARSSSDTGEYAVQILDGEGDVGWYPSAIVDSEGVVHVSYVDAINHDLLYINDQSLESQLVDDGYRIVGTTEEGLPLPEFHFVGDDSSISLTADGIHITYQDATNHELIVAYPNASQNWSRITIAGDEDPFAGAYGFFANSKYDGTDLTMSSWVLDQGNSDNWVELFRRTITITIE